MTILQNWVPRFSDYTPSGYSGVSPNLILMTMFTSHGSTMVTNLVSHRIVLYFKHSVNYFD